MPERLKGHDWKSCVPNKIGTEGSNPSLSATNHVGFVAAVYHVRCMISTELNVVQDA
jgi:hypothetical protein